MITSDTTRVVVGSSFFISCPSIVMEFDMEFDIFCDELCFRSFVPMCNITQSGARARVGLHRISCHLLWPLEMFLPGH